MGFAEKLSNNSYVRMSRKGRKWLKRYAAKLRRLAERQDPENAPKHKLKGWAD